MTPMTIDELARAAGMTVRTVRNYQTKGLVAPPELRGRTGLYGAEHLARLRLIQEMQEAGFNLAAIKRLLDTVPEGAGSAALHLGHALLSPWLDEEPEVLSPAELAARFGAPDPDALDRAARAGVLRVLDDGRIELPVPSLARAGQEVMALGIPLDQALDVTEHLVAAADRIAEVFVELFLRNLWRPFDEAGRPAEQWPELSRALERLKPLASRALLAAFQARMTEAVEQAFGAEIAIGRSEERAAG